MRLQLANDGTDTRSFRHTLDTRTFSTVCAIRNSHQRGSIFLGGLARLRQVRVRLDLAINFWPRIRVTKR